MAKQAAHTDSNSNTAGLGTRSEALQNDEQGKSERRTQDTVGRYNDAGILALTLGGTKRGGACRWEEEG